MLHFKKLSWLLVILGLFLLTACSNDYSSSDSAVATIYPDQPATIGLGEAEVYFPAGAVQRSVDVIVSVKKDLSRLPENIHPITFIYTISLSDPSAYATDEDEATLRFSINTGGKAIVYYSNDGMKSWKDWGGIQKDRSIEVIMVPGNLGEFVVGEAPPMVPVSHMRKGPYLMLTGKNTEMQIQWQTAIDMQKAPCVQWAKHDGTGSTNTECVPSGTDNTFWYTMNELTPGTRYDYTVILSDGEKYSGEFMTPPPDDALKTTFYAYGDTRTQPATHNDVVHVLRHDAIDDKNMADQRQTFVLHTGDFVHRGMDEGYWNDNYFHNRTYVSTNEFLASFPIMPAVGNHEFKDNDGNYSETADLFYKYWENPIYPNWPDVKSYYYSFDYGPVHISVIDPYTVPYAPGDAQYQWLKSDLEGTDKQWKIVACHHPFYDAGSGSPKGDVGPYANTIDLQKNIQPLLEANNVKLVLQGHRHYYSRSTVNGITYLVLGAGGAPLTAIPSEVPYYDVKPDYAASVYHFARIDADTTGLTVTVTRVHDAEPSLLETVHISPEIVLAGNPWERTMGQP